MEQRTCAKCQNIFIISGVDAIFYQKMSVSPPTRCPICREKRRFVFRNERSLYRRSCDHCQKSVISIYSPSKPFTVYCQKCWWGDSWDAKNFAREFNFNRLFFEQFGELMGTVPRYALYNVNGLNSEYCQQVMDNKDCYFCFVMKGCESCRYLTHSLSNRDSADSAYLRESELCYECLDSVRLYNCMFCEHSTGSRDCVFGYDLVNCSDCFGCVNLRNKQYHIFNTPYSKEAYESAMQEFRLNTHEAIEGFRAQFEEFKTQFPRRAVWNVNTENSTGNNIQNTKNCSDCFDSFDLQDCSRCTWTFKNKDCHDAYGMGESELIYESIGDEEVTRAAFTMFVTRSSDVSYSDSCFSSRNLFGCVGVKKGEYMVFNKAYSKNAYEALTTKICRHMESTGEFGEFFPENLSPFEYNESIAQVYYPQ